MHDQDASQENNQLDTQEPKQSNDYLNVLNQANLLINQRNLEQAAVLYEELLLETKMTREETYEVYAKLSDCYLSSGDVNKALLSSFQSFTYGIPHPVICYKIGVSFMENNQVNLAIFWFDMATKETIAREHVNYDAAFSNWLPHLQLSVCYYKLGKQENAFHHHKLARNFNPNHPSILSNENYFNSIFQQKGSDSLVESKKNDSGPMDGDWRVLDINQNDVHFTGERILINDFVKLNYGVALEEHLCRYRFSQKFVKNKRVLDAACGAGFGSKMLQAAGASHVLGIDIDEACLENARKTYGHDQISYTYGNVNKLELEDKSFDIIVSFETIEHIDDGSVWIKESARLLKDDGFFIVSTPNRNLSNAGAYFVEKPLNHYHKYEYTIVEFVGNC